MTRRATVALGFALAALFPFASHAWALEECRLLRQPDIQGDHIVFVYAGDLWTVSRGGGVAERITSSEGQEVFPKFSPDGKTIAFTGEYDGNVDAYTIPAEGGAPTRLTWHPANDQVAEWYPDGKSILIRSRRASAIQRYDRFFKVPAAGGFEEMLALPTAGYCSFSSDGSQIAFVSPSYDNRTWKRYRGGNAAQIWIYDFKKNTSEKITDWEGPNEWPMWHERTIYYCSDKGGRQANLWAYDVDKKSSRQVTHFDDYDVKWPSIGSDAIVFEKGGYLWVMDLPGEQAHQIQVLVPDDKPYTRAGYRDVAPYITSMDLSPSAKRAVFEARGELFTVPAEKGDVRALTNTPGARERDPAWSPDGKWIAYLSDQTGEYEIWVIPGDGQGAARQVTKNGNAFRFQLRWSPDSKKLAFSDKAGVLWWCDVASGKLTRADKADHGEIHDYAWAPDSRWLAYSKGDAAGFGLLQLYSLDTGSVTQVSDGMTDDSRPVFDPAGNYLYFVSSRTLHPVYDQFEFNFQFGATSKIYALSLRDTLGSPVAPESDEEMGDGKKGGDDSAAKDDKSSKKSEKSGGGSADSGAKPVQIDLEGLGSRVSVLPVPTGRYFLAGAYKGKVVYFSFHEPDPDADEAPDGSVQYFDLDKRKVKTVIADVSADIAISKDGSKLLYKAKDTYGITDMEDGKKVGDDKITTSPMMAYVDPPQEWMQMFNEAWRLERDFYYDPAMGGLDWKAVGEHYRKLVPYVAHRADLNYILGELIGELSTSHTYVGGGDVPDVKRVDTGLLGADYDFDAASGRYRFKTIYRARDWNSSVEAPLGVPGVNVKEGDYLLAVNGRPLKAPDNLYSAFTATTGKQTRITVGRSPNDASPRTYVVKPIGNESSLRYTAWVAANRAKVDKATGRRVAYIHVPNTATQGIQEFTKQYYPQVDKEGIIVDERFNGGGFVPDFFVERLRRTTLAYWARRDAKDERTPSSAIDGPKCILINQYAGSGGDAFPYYFKEMGIGPVIGMRTWGGLVGISHSLPLVDGGSVTMPDFGMWDPHTGQWAVENHGVDPDIAVENSPSDMVAGHDPQLERAIQWSLDQLAKNPPKKPERPPYKVQAGLPTATNGHGASATGEASANR
jgi:tricorn protease